MKIAEERYWRTETVKFRKDHPGIYRQSRLRENVAKILSKPLNQWRESKRQNIKNWLLIENYLLSGKAKPEKLLRMLGNAQDSAKKTVNIEENFLKLRAIATKAAFKKTDVNAIQRMLAMKDLKAMINAEKMFFGRIKDLGKAGKLAQFGELLTRLKLSNDNEYAKYRGMVVLAGMGIGEQRVKTDKRIRELAEEYATRKINEVEYIKQQLLAEYALTHQYFNLVESGEKMYACLEKNAKDKGLKKILNEIKREMNQRKLIYRIEITKIEMKFKKKK